MNVQHKEPGFLWLRNKQEVRRAVIGNRASSFAHIAYPWGGVSNTNCHCLVAFSLKDFGRKEASEGQLSSSYHVTSIPSPPLFSHILYKTEDHTRSTYITVLPWKNALFYPLLRRRPVDLPKQYKTFSLLIIILRRIMLREILKRGGCIYPTSKSNPKPSNFLGRWILI